MRWFKRGRQDAAPPPMPALDPAVIALFDEVGLAAFDRQLGLAELVEDRDWSFEQDRGTLRFGTDLEMPAQALGSVSHQSGTWLWSWANPSLRSELTTLAQEARHIGEERGLGVLVEPNLDADAVGGGHLLALVTAGLAGADAYYRCPRPGGELYLAVTAPQVRTSAMDAESRAVMVIGQCVSAFAVPLSRTAVAAYLRSLGLAVTEDADGVRVDDGSRTAALYDELGRMTELRGQIRPAPRPGV